MQNKKIFIIIIVFLVLIISTGVVVASIFLSKKGDVSESGFRQNVGQKASNCQSVYEEVLDMNKFDFSQCTQSNIRVGNFEESDVVQKQNNLVIIFDASGSMAGQVDGQPKIAIAKNAVKKYIDSLGNDKNVNLSIIVYGHKGSNSHAHKPVSCNGIEEIYYLGGVDAVVAKRKIDSFSATGWTPIARSLDKAGEILKSNPVNGESFVLLVSDGKETCDGDPIAAVKGLNASGMKVTANVIGFDVGGEDERQLKNIAEAGGGDYFSVKNAQDFELVFQKHENILKKAHYKIGRTVEQIYDISNVMLEYNQCMTMLKREEAAMMLDIHASKLAGEKCEEYADAEYWERHAKFKKIIEDNFKSDKDAFNSLEE